ncbi:hypothetical protein [Pseudoflavitalea rhizosphaerae]|uniref:hypothetical protein n=1 Tax=Pseudoflavitalea rhizosphaerae TaxID=1884793 RepID=UPI000F8C8857|nr:hypothetical protein [Pseudoflavitalea rhizosphaerae]
MKDFIQYINQYSEFLRQSAVWHNTKDIIAPVIGIDDKEAATDNYIYEFYCLIKILEDLRYNYEIRFVEGKGNFKYRFPQAAAPKGGKPRFHAFIDDKMEFQICAGTMIKCEIDTEKNHPDISFQVAESSNDPSQEDLIIIMDAKFKESQQASLPKDEVYKFGQIVDLFNLRREPQIKIKFSKYKSFLGNCLITNVASYSNNSDIRLLQKLRIKEVEKFSPTSNYNVLG